MRIFVQMSVGGFKVFDVAAFAHECDQGRYATIAEVAETQQGVKDSQTHIIRNNMHGMRLETMRLFSSPDVSLLLHDDLYADELVRCLFVGQTGQTKDSFKRDCEVSFCVMGQNAHENEAVNRLAYYVAVLQDEEVLSQLAALLHTSKIDDVSVLVFDIPKWNALLNRINAQSIPEDKPLCADVAHGNIQLAVIHDSLSGRQVYENQPGLFNDSQYWILHRHDLPIAQHYELVSKQPEYLTSRPRENTGSEHLVYDKRFRDFLKELMELINKYSK